LHSSITPGDDNWIQTGAGISGLSWVYYARKHDSQVELYIDWDKDKGEGNKRIFDEFKDHEKEVGAAFGSALEWKRLDGKRACRIMHLVDGGYMDEERWPEIHDVMIDAMVRLEGALSPYVAKLSVGQ
jgi:hypothetical protein